MMKFNLETDSIWNEIARVLTHIKADELAREHLKSCQYRLEGYWDGEQFYEVVHLSPSLEVTLDNIAFSTTTNGSEKDRLIKLNFLLSQDDEEFGQLWLLFNSSLEFVDENWSINVTSPFVVPEFRQPEPTAVQITPH